MSKPNRVTGLPVQVAIDDLAFVAADAIARPVTASLRATTALLRRFELAGGAALARQLRFAEPLPVGSAVVTGAGELDVELIIHAVVSSDDEPVSRNTVRQALASALHRAADFGIERLAVPPFGLGAGNLDVEDCAGVMLDVIQRHLRAGRPPSHIIVVVENDHEADAFRLRLSRTAA